jgi:hypothetical protein
MTKRVFCLAAFPALSAQSATLVRKRSEPRRSARLGD